MSTPRRHLLAWLAFFLALAAGGPAATASNEKEAATAVDSGSFGIFKNGQRIATETFSIKESAAGKTISSHLASAGAGGQQSEQSCELRLSANGSLMSYEWREKSPGSAEITVTPKDEFLIQRSLASPGAKAAEQTLLMPVSSMVLDNNFFVLREVLAWRYLASSCKTENGSLNCSKAPAHFGVVVPQDHMSMSVTVELAGAEKVRIGQAERELLRLNLNDDNGLWQLWIDSQDKFKLIRIVMAADGTEILRQ